MYFTFCFVGIFMLGRDIFFALYVSCFNCLFALIYVLIVCCLESRIYFIYLYFPHIRLCILFSVSGNIQVDSIELLSTLANDG